MDEVIYNIPLQEQVQSVSQIMGLEDNKLGRMVMSNTAQKNW
jgi:hypothetical protein